MLKEPLPQGSGSFLCAWQEKSAKLIKKIEKNDENYYNVLTLL